MMVAVTQPWIEDALEDDEHEDTIDVAEVFERVWNRAQEDPLLQLLFERFCLTPLQRRILAMVILLPMEPDAEMLEGELAMDVDDGLALEGVLCALKHLGSPMSWRVLMPAIERLYALGLVDGLDLDGPPWMGSRELNLSPSRCLWRVWLGLSLEPCVSDILRIEHPRVLWNDVVGDVRRPTQGEPGDMSGRTIVIRGPKGSGRTHVARALATEARALMLFLKDAFQPEEHLRGLVFCVHWLEAWVVPHTNPWTVIEALRPFSATLMLLSDSKDTERLQQQDCVDDDALHVFVHPPTTPHRARLWKRMLRRFTCAQDVVPERLARLYRLDYSGIAAVVQEAVAGREEGTVIRMADIREPLMHRFRARRPPALVELEPRARLKDILVPAKTQDELLELLDACRHYEDVLEAWGLGGQLSRGRGIIALFSGEPGTGKTLAAEALAKELGRSFLKVEMSALVSKYVGETGKRIAEVFENVDPLSTVLLFDEADGLFQRRTEAKSSNDRYANMDTNLLLQHLEAFDGIAILTTNLDTHMDNAVRRRISYAIRFPEPSPRERAAMFARIIPDNVPTSGDLGLEEIAELADITGGHIKNCVVRALHIARAEDSPLMERHLYEATMRECRALGKLLVSRDPA